ncbi:TAFII55 protein conserved region-domain-containing protein [Hyaloraphidium curvatum]|nr:TAFII55 protein conserved region-domain-containing protein [Hyaloraphidium curvatum]
MESPAPFSPSAVPGSPWPVEGGAATPGGQYARALPSTVRQTRAKPAPTPRSPPPVGASPPSGPKPKRQARRQPKQITNIKLKVGGRVIGGDEDRAEQHFVLRLPDPEMADRFRSLIADGQAPPPETFRVRFHSDRRATVSLDGHSYRATLKDLPAVVESWKSHDRVQWWKIADVHQVLVVEGMEPPAAQDLPEPGKEEYELKDGLTPPLKNVVNRRFRKPQIKKQIESVEKEVERLLRKDKLAFEVTTQWRAVPRNVVEDGGTEAGGDDSDDFDEDRLANDLEMGIADEASGEDRDGSEDEDEDEEDESGEDEEAARRAELQERLARLESELAELQGKIAEKEDVARGNNEWRKSQAQQQLAGLRRDWNDKASMLRETTRMLKSLR